jgi:hypothetical protein
VTMTDGGDVALVNKFAQQLMDDKEFMRGLNEVRITSTKKEVIENLPATRFGINCVGKNKELFA